MNMMVNIPQTNCFTHKQLRQLLIAYSQVNNIEHNFGACMVNHLYDVQQCGGTCQLLNTLHTQEKTLAAHIKKHGILGGDFKNRPRDIEFNSNPVSAQKIKMSVAERMAQNNRYLTDDEVERFTTFFDVTGARAGDFAALFGHSNAWLSQILHRHHTSNKGLLMRLVCLLDSEMEMFNTTGSCRTLRKEVSTGYRRLNQQEAKLLTALKESRRLAHLSLKAGFSRTYLGETLRLNRVMPADKIQHLLVALKDFEVAA